MATVYLAQDLKHDRKVALKVLKPELAAVLGAERFVQSRSRPPRRCSIPHILPLFDSRRAPTASSTTSCRTSRARRCARKLDRETQLGIDEAVRIATRGGRRARLRAPPRRDPPRHQAREHPAARRPRDGRRLRHRARRERGGRRPDDRDRPVARHAALHEPRAGDRGEGHHRPLGHLLARRACCTRCSPAIRRTPARSAQQIIMKIVDRGRRGRSPSCGSRCRRTSRRRWRRRWRSCRPTVRDARGVCRGAARSRLSHGDGTTGRRGRPSRARTATCRPLVTLADLLLAAALVRAGEAATGPAGDPLRSPPAAVLQIIRASADALRGSRRLHPVRRAGRRGQPALAQAPEQLPASPIPGTAGARAHHVARRRLGRVHRERPAQQGAHRAAAARYSSPGQPRQHLRPRVARRRHLVYPLRGAAGLMRVPDAGGTPTLLCAPTPSSRSSPIRCLAGTASPSSAPTPAAPRRGLGIGLSGGAPRRLVNSASAVSSRRPTISSSASSAGGLFAVPLIPARTAVTGDRRSARQLLPDNGAPASTCRPAARSWMVGGGPARGPTSRWCGCDRTGHETPRGYAAGRSSHGHREQPRVGALARRHPAGDRSRHVVGDDIWVKPLPVPRTLPGHLRSALNTARAGRPDNQYITSLGIRRPGRSTRHRADGTGTDSLLVAGTMDEGVVSPDGRWLVLREGSVGSVRGGRNITGVRLGTDTSGTVLSTEFDEEAIALPPTASGWPTSPTRLDVPKSSSGRFPTPTPASAGLQRRRRGAALVP